LGFRNLIRQGKKIKAGRSIRLSKKRGKRTAKASRSRTLLREYEKCFAGKFCQIRGKELNANTRSAQGVFSRQGEAERAESDAFPEGTSEGGKKSPGKDR